MSLHSLVYNLPKTPRFAGESTWFPTFLGGFVLPMLATDLIESYWFSRYQIGQDKSVRFRFKVADGDYPKVLHRANELEQALGMTRRMEELNYDGSDLRALRFEPANPRRLHADQRFELVWNFLCSTARLYLDCLAHEDPVTHTWSMELNTDIAHNAQSDTVETFHHMFCNITGLQPLVYETGIAASPIMSHLYYLNQRAAEWKAQHPNSQGPVSFDQLPRPLNAYRVSF